MKKVKKLPVMLLFIMLANLIFPILNIGVKTDALANSTSGPLPSPLLSYAGEYFLDECSDLSKAYSSTSAYLEGYAEVPERLWGDESIIRPKAGSSDIEKYIIYKSEKDITAFAVRMYFYKNNQQIKIYTSTDGANYIEQEVGCNRLYKQDIDTDGDGTKEYTTFYEALFYSTNLEAGIKYLKIEWLTSYEGGATEGMLSSVEYICNNAKSKLDKFITRDGHKLYEGAKKDDESNRFRFVSFETACLGYIEDGYYGPSNEYEIRDLLESVVQMGATAVRIHTASFREATYNGASVGGIPEGGTGANKNLAFIEGVETDGDGNSKIIFNEAVLRGFDKMLQLCNEYGVRVIFPVIDGNEHWGGIANLAAWQGLDLSYFWTDKQLRDQTKTIYKYFIERTNYYTGIKYKDDPAILCWQVGNEMERHRVTDEWALEMAQYIKSLDKNHLVAAPQNRLWKNIVDSEYIDIVDGHYYGETQFEEKLIEDTAACTGKAAMMLGEIGYRSGTRLAEFLEYMLGFDQIAGGCVFSLSGHNRNGGLYKHGGTTSYTTYNYPGFDNERVYEFMEEKVIIAKIKELAYGLKGEEVPAIPTPAAPKMLPVTDLSDIRWRGSVGASGYDVQRAAVTTKDASAISESDWVTIKEDVTDNVRVWRTDLSELHRIMFSDDEFTIESGKTYFYRVRAKNESGVSDWSNARYYGDASKDADIIAEQTALLQNIAAGNTYVSVEDISDEKERNLPKTLKRADLSEEMRYLLRPAAVFNIQKDIAFVSNVIVNLEGAPFSQNSTVYVPCTVLEDVFDLSVEVNDNSDITIIANGIVVQAKAESGSWTFQETDINGINPPLVKNNIVYVPLDVVCNYIYGNDGNIPTYTTYGYENHDLYINGNYAIVYADEIKDKVSEFEKASFYTALDTAMNNPAAAVLKDESDFEENMLVDGGFESADIIYSWEVPAVSINITSNEVHSGNFALKMDHDYNYPGIRIHTPCEQNTTYILSFWILAPDYWDGASYSFGVKVLNNTHGLAELLNKSIRHYYSTSNNAYYLENNNTWQYVSWEFNSDTAKELRLAYTLSPTGVTYIDDVSIVKKAPAVSLKLKNGDAEINELSELTSGENLTLSADITNNINACISDVYLIGAVYNGTQLEDVVISKKLSAEAADDLQTLTSDKTLSLSGDLSKKNVKLFLWNGFEMCSPLTEFKHLE